MAESDIPLDWGLCSISGCGRLRHSRGWCAMHWHRWYKYGAPNGHPGPTIEQRFWAKVAKGEPDECWSWTGATGNGYGKFYFDGTARYAHAFSYRLHYGPALHTDYVLHSCDNKLCVNPAHLDAGTPKRNTGEAATRGLLSRKLNWEQAIAIRGSTGSPDAIGAKYGISRRMVWMIRTGKAWTVENQPSPSSLLKQADEVGQSDNSQPVGGSVDHRHR